MNDTTSSLYAVQVNYVRHGTDGDASGQLPTFYLDERTQGIVNTEHAERIARDILFAGRKGEPGRMSFYVTAVKL